MEFTIFEFWLVSGRKDPASEYVMSKCNCPRLSTGTSVVISANSDHRLSGWIYVLLLSHCYDLVKHLLLQLLGQLDGKRGRTYCKRLTNYVVRWNLWSDKILCLEHSWLRSEFYQQWSLSTSFLLCLPPFLLVLVKITITNRLVLQWRLLTDRKGWQIVMYRNGLWKVYSAAWSVPYQHSVSFVNMWLFRTILGDIYVLLIFFSRHGVSLSKFRLQFWYYR